MEPKRQQWEVMRLEVSRITDKLNLPVDEGIVDTVIVFRLLGFNTTVSCEGHTNRVTGGPYVAFASTAATEYAAQANTEKAQNGLSEKYKELRSLANYHSTLEMQKLLPFLESFYRNRPTPYANRLIVRSFPMTYNCLKCQGAELAYTMDQQERDEMLKAHQQEMRDFTIFLKAVFFKESERPRK